MNSDSVIGAVRLAVASQPANPELRLHLATLLLDANLPAEALAECRAVIDHAAGSAAAFALAGRAAAALGDASAASAYQQTAALLEPTTSVAAPSDPPASVHDASGDETLHDGRNDDEEGELVPFSPLRVVRDPVASRAADSEERPTITLADVAGLDRVKRRLHTAFLGPLANPKLRRDFAKSLRGGMLLYGPPGCGKTFIARALAGELRARFLSITLVDVLGSFQGQSEHNLHALFENARRSAPCVVFLDEVDALGQKRANLRGSADRGIVAQLLTELDSVDSINEGVFVLGATNHPWDVDPALRRPGRFDRTILVMPPDRPARAAILSAGLEGRPHAALDLDQVAERTKGYSGADLAHLCDTAAEFALEASVEKGSTEPITMGLIDRALDEVKPSTSTWIQTAKNYAQFANEGGVYDDLLRHLREDVDA